MSSDNSYAETAESILEHAEAITRLDPRGTEPADAYDEAYRRHVHAMRVLAAPHVDPSLDRVFLKELRTAFAGGSGASVHFEDGIVHVIVDSAHRQHRFDLLSPSQIDRRGYDEMID
ncbi:hypothetical protein ACFFGH_02720 [Lysobacter korlensis]|uniref:Uncharacterized protein n=1 Tax=Lysobacter korlensis TaxID=553636 RepID=A0ABV6RK52_9GAMM